jgi:nucleoside-diphosphate kinase
VKKERTLVLIKPDGMERRLGHTIIAEIILLRGMRIDRYRRVQLTPEIVDEHYAMHRGKTFFPALVAYMTRSPCFAMIVSGENAISKVRDLAGNTYPEKANVHTLRGRYGRTMPGGTIENVIHSSDTPEQAEAEIERFFGKETFWTRLGNMLYRILWNDGEFEPRTIGSEQLYGDTK